MGKREGAGVDSEKTSDICNPNVSLEQSRLSEELTTVAPIPNKIVPVRTMRTRLSRAYSAYTLIVSKANL